MTGMPTHWQHGDFGLVRTNTPTGWLIRLFTRSQVSHAFVYIGFGKIIEASATGARVANLSKYDGKYVVRSKWGHHLTSTDRAAIVTAATRLLGTPYNFLDILALGLMILGFKGQWLLSRAQSSQRLICSQLVDRAYRNAGLALFTDHRPDGQVAPGDLLLLLADRRAFPAHVLAGVRA